MEIYSWENHLEIGGVQLLRLMTPGVHIIYLWKCGFSANTNVDLFNSNNEGATSKNWDGDTLRQAWRKNHPCPTRSWSVFSGFFLPHTVTPIEK